MQHITGIPRNRMCFSPDATGLEDTISSENLVRFVAALSLEALGFSVQTIKSEGRSSLDTKIFLKLYMYGYLNRLRSFR